MNGLKAPMHSKQISNLYMVIHLKIRLAFVLGMVWKLWCFILVIWIVFV